MLLNVHCILIEQAVIRFTALRSGLFKVLRLETITYYFTKN